MGGETILGILEAAPWTHEDVHTLILQPQTKIDLLRCWLCGHGYRFLSETLVRDKEQLYVVFRVRAGMGQELSEADALTGLLLRSDPLYGEYLSQHLIKLNRARDGLAVSSLADKEARIAHLENLIEEIERRKGEWEHGNGYMRSNRGFFPGRRARARWTGTMSATSSAIPSRRSSAF